MIVPYHPPVKQSLKLAGHQTSISLEPVFWEMLRKAAAENGVAVASLVQTIDAERIKADPAPGLAGAVRIWLVTKALNTNDKGVGMTPTAPAEVACNNQ